MTPPRRGDLGILRGQGWHRAPMGARATQTPVPCNAPPPLSIVTCRPTRLALNDAPDPKEGPEAEKQPGAMSFDYRVRPRRTRGGKEQAEQELTIGKRACHLLQAVLRYDFPCSAAMSGGFLSGIGNPSYEYRLRRVAFRLLVLLWDQGRR